MKGGELRDLKLSLSFFKFNFNLKKRLEVEDLERGHFGLMGEFMQEKFLPFRIKKNIFFIF